MKLPLELQYIALINKIMEGPDSYSTQQVRESLLEKWLESEDNGELTITEKGRIRLHVLDAIAKLERDEVRVRATSLEADKL